MAGRERPSTGPAPPATVAPLAESQGRAGGRVPTLSDSTSRHLERRSAAGRALVLTDSPPQPIGARAAARPCRQRRFRLPGQHGPDGRNRVPPVPLAARGLRRRRAPRGAWIPRRRGRAGAARIQSLLLAPAAHGPCVLVPDDGSAADLLPGDLAAALLLPQGPSAGALGPAAARPALCSPGAGDHHLQQAPERQGPLCHLARADGAAGRAVHQWAVRRGRAPVLPQADEELDSGQAEAVPRNLRAGGLPAGLCQPDAGHVLPLVHHHGDRCLVVPRHAVSPRHQPGYHEPGEQCVPVPQTEPALRAWC